MSKFIFTETDLSGAFVIEPTIFGDSRGYFVETYQKEEFYKAGIAGEFVQDNQSKSHKGVLRGLHFQKNYPQGKLVRVISGNVFDVAVDLRKNSPSYGKWTGIILSAENKKQFYIPRGFAHGFLVLSDEAEFVYKCDEYYHPEDEGGFRWDDPGIGIKWPVLDDISITVNDRDRSFPLFNKQYERQGSLL